MATSAAAYHRRALKSRRRRTRARLGAFSYPLILAASLFCVLIACFFVKTWLNHKVVSVGYEISRLEEENRKLREDYQKLTVELSNLTSLSRIERIATRKLGLKVPSPEQIVKVR